VAANLHEKDLPAVREIVKIGGVETIVEIPVLMITTRAVIPGSWSIKRVGRRTRATSGLYRTAIDPV
jgi:hypothetical protein